MEHELLIKQMTAQDPADYAKAWSSKDIYVPNSKWHETSSSNEEVSHNTTSTPDKQMNGSEKK